MNELQEMSYKLFKLQSLFRKILCNYEEYNLLTQEFKGCCL